MSAVWFCASVPCTPWNCIVCPCVWPIVVTQTVLKCACPCFAGCIDFCDAKRCYQTDTDKRLAALESSAAPTNVAMGRGFVTLNS